MTRLALVFLFLLFSCTYLYSQNKIDANIGYGHYLSNSENSMNIMGEKRFASYLFYGFSYQRDNFLGINLIINYSYHQINEENLFRFVYYIGDGEPPPTTITGDIRHISHNVDFNYAGNFNKYFSYGVGVSFVIANRILSLVRIVNDKETLILYDKLASSGIGVNSFAMFSVPFTKDKNYFYFTSMLKFRYTYSVWFDEGIRDLDNYYQEYFTTQLSIGVGYSF